MPTKAEIYRQWYVKLKADPERWAEHRRKNIEKSRKWQEANRERAKEGRRNWYEANREVAYKKKRERLEANREHYLNYHREYYSANREAMLKRGRQYRAANLETQREYDRSRGKTPSRRELVHRYHERGKAIIARAKIGMTCECGEGNPAILEFHHIDPSQKLAAVGERVKGWSEDRILAEIDKCVLWCVNCHRVHEWENRDRTGTSKIVVHVRRTKEILSSIKTETGCRCCGNSDFRCLDFHHIDPSTKLFTIAVAAGKGVSRKRLLAEIAKCEVLCANCHRLEHLQIKKTRQRIEELEGKTS